MENKDSILVTLSQAIIKERDGGYKKIIQEWLASDGENLSWWFRMGNAPKREFLYIYWVVAGRIRYRCLATMYPSDQVTLDDGRILDGKNWACCFDFEAIPRALQLNKKGFQGFRYFDSSNITF